MGHLNFFGHKSVSQFKSELGTAICYLYKYIMYSVHIIMFETCHVQAVNIPKVECPVSVLTKCQKVIQNFGEIGRTGII